MNNVITPTTSEFVVQVDQREQAPYLFDGLKDDDGRPLFVYRNDATLKTGDYSIRDMEAQITVERKSHTDFLGSIGKGRARLQREFERMAEMERAAIVVETGMRELIQESHQYSQMKPKTIQRTIVSWSLRYPTVQWFFCYSRRHAEVTTFQYLNRFWELKKAKEI